MKYQFTNRDFGDGERIQEKKDFGQIHTWEFSLHRRRETSGRNAFADE
jgi:hypothetical protein